MNTQSSSLSSATWTWYTFLEAKWTSWSCPRLWPSKASWGPESPPETCLSSVPLSHPSFAVINRTWMGSVIGRIMFSLVGTTWRWCKIVHSDMCKAGSVLQITWTGGVFLPRRDLNLRVFSDELVSQIVVKIVVVSLDLEVMYWNEVDCDFVPNNAVVSEKLSSGRVTCLLWGEWMKGHCSTPFEMSSSTTVRHVSILGVLGSGYQDLRSSSTLCSSFL